MRKTADPVNEDSDEEKSSWMDTPADPVEDPLKWLDDGLPDLSRYNNRSCDAGRYRSERSGTGRGGVGEMVVDRERKT